MFHNIYWYQNPQSSGVDAGDTILQYWLSTTDHKHQNQTRKADYTGGKNSFAKLSAFVKYVIKFLGRANPVTNFEFAEEYVKNNKQNTYLIFVFLPYPIPNLDYVSHTRFNCHCKTFQIFKY